MTLTYDLIFRRDQSSRPELCRKVGYTIGGIDYRGMRIPPLWEIETRNGERLYVAPETVEERHHD